MPHCIHVYAGRGCRAIVLSSLVTFDRPDGRIWRHRQDHVLVQLSEAGVWRRTTQAARDEGLLFMTNSMHCMVGSKPVGEMHA